MIEIDDDERRLWICPDRLFPLAGAHKAGKNSNFFLDS
jgi:hypothetical protein